MAKTPREIEAEAVQNATAHFLSIRPDMNSAATLALVRMVATEAARQTATGFATEGLLRDAAPVAGDIPEMKNPLDAFGDLIPMLENGLGMLKGLANKGKQG